MWRYLRYCFWEYVVGDPWRAALCHGPALEEGHGNFHAPVVCGRCHCGHTV